MNLKEIEKAVAKVQEQLFNKANDHSIGLFKSQFRGSGIQFKEHQIYTPGDDVRFIDWKLSAKSVNKTFVKTFEEERNIEVISVLDLSPTMFMGFEGKAKIEVALEIIFLVYLITQKTKDYQRVIIFADDIIQLPRMSGRLGISLVLSQLKKIGVWSEKGFDGKNFKYKGETKKKINFLKSYIAKRKEILYFTDFYAQYSKKEFDKFLSHPNFHCFGLRTPLDTANSQPFSFFSDFNGEKSFIYKLKSKSVEKKDKRYKNLKYLDLDKNYFDDFISSMR